MSKFPSFSSVRVRLVGVVLMAIAPAWVVMYLFAYDPPWMRFAVGLLALGAAWFGGERFILRQLRTLSRAASDLAAGDLTSRAGLADEKGELGELARRFDEMADTMEHRVRQRDQAEATLVTRSLQQTVVSALGQFALVSNDFNALLHQAVMLTAQTLEVEYCHILELLPGAETMVLRAGTGCKPDAIGQRTVSAHPKTQEGFTLTAGEPVVVDDLATERRFLGSPLLFDYGVVSGVTVAIVGQGHAFGVLGAHTTHRRRFSEDEVHFLLAVATVLAMAAARKRAEAELEKLASFAQLNPNPAMELNRTGDLTYFNDAAFKLAQSVGTDHPRGILPTNIAGIVHTCLTTRQTRLSLETRKEGRTLHWSFHPVFASGVVHAYVEDVTDRLNLEAQLRQSQKMESVGQLAAGVAHDFNNMLTIIQGHSGILMARSAQRPEVFDSSQAIYFAAERAASLTRQLLMFSRKSVMQPKLLDLRDLVLQLSKMLKRLLGETITLEFNPPPELAPVCADAGMIEQVIMNLVVNARDAMPKGGRLIISLSQVEIDEAYVNLHPESRIGPFVCLRVTDNGCGMDNATMARIFEPFFTTKEIGKGTGLGLATVYGIVKQHDGWIEVLSQVGKGTTFSVLFPAGDESPAAGARVEEPAETHESHSGKETILVVEDEPVLREMAHLILKECGYHVLEAGSGREALEVWDRHQARIDLVLTDMVMPEGLSGMDLAHLLHATHPSLKIIFASGYSMEDIDTDFVRDGHATFLQKPYTHVTLARAVRESLDGQTKP